MRISVVPFLCHKRLWKYGEYDRYVRFFRGSRRVDVRQKTVMNDRSSGT